MTRPPLVVIAVANLLLVLCPASSQAARWDPIHPADLARTSCEFEPDADAEALFWDVTIRDEFMGGDLRTVLDHHLRIQVFNARGIEAHGTIEIPYWSGISILDVEGRTIRRDGSIVALDPKTVFDRVTVQVGGRKAKVKSFAMPALEPGAILEYRYREIRWEGLAHYLRLNLSSSFPVKTLTYAIKPLPLPGVTMRCRSFQAPAPVFTSDRRGFNRTRIENVRSHRDEPYMPAERRARAWMLVFYTAEEPNPDRYWLDFSRRMFDAYRGSMKPTARLRQAAEEAIGDAREPEEKLRRLYAYCRDKIRNTADEADSLGAEERIELPKNRRPEDALANGTGTRFDVNMVFAALCEASGFAVRIAWLADRTDVVFDRSFADGYFLRRTNVAVLLGDGWALFDPGDPALSFGRLRWEEEGVSALVCDGNRPQWIETGISGPDVSRTIRTGEFRLDPAGNLEGDVRLEFTGHVAIDERAAWLERTPETRESALRDQVAAALGSAEVSAVGFENGADHDRPFVVSYHVRAPGFAIPTGKRLLLQPGYFQHGATPLFPARERVHPVAFRYAWSSLDSVALALPEGWEIEGGESPAPVNAEGVCRYVATAGVNQDASVLVWTRALEFGASGSLWFPRSEYPALQRLFDVIATRDQHAILLRPRSETP